MPCTARNAASSYMFCDMPQSTEPTMKIPMANRKNGRRPYMSESLP